MDFVGRQTTLAILTPSSQRQNQTHTQWSGSVPPCLLRFSFLICKTGLIPPPRVCCDIRGLPTPKEIPQRSIQGGASPQAPPSGPNKAQWVSSGPSPWILCSRKGSGDVSV